jgi:cardiolipin synthase
LYKNLPNLLTYFRIIIIPLLIASCYIEGTLHYWIPSILFLIAGITDYFDGFLARKLQAGSAIGKFLDPIADKLLVAASILMLLHFDHLGKYDVIPAVVILCREILISGLREFLAGEKLDIPVTFLAKVKTAAQMIAIGLLLWGPEGPNFVVVEELVGITFTELVGRVLLWLAGILTIITGYGYMKVGLTHILKENA